MDTRLVPGADPLRFNLAPTVGDIKAVNKLPPVQLITRRQHHEGATDLECGSWTSECTKQTFFKLLPRWVGSLHPRVLALAH